jgi:hypothetical protein
MDKKMDKITILDMMRYGSIKKAVQLIHKD